MKKYINQVNELWEKRDFISKTSEEYRNAKKILQVILEDLDKGSIRVCEKFAANWITNDWVKKAILLYFSFYPNKVISSTFTQCYDKIPIKFDDWDEEEFKKSMIRVVSGAVVRLGAYIGKGSVIMPSFINIGAYVGDYTLIDTWSTVGSCAQIGNHCHISGGVGIGGVLEPIQSKPVIIEDNCFIGARSEITEGVLIESGSVLGMGVYLSASTKIVYRETGEIIYGRVPSNSVVVPGTLPNKENPNAPALSCAVIVKQVDQKTRSKTSINDLLRIF